jgi:hypothetical protein
MSIIFVVLSRMSPMFEFEYHECAARVVFSNVGIILPARGIICENCDQISSYRKLESRPFMVRLNRTARNNDGPQ